MNEPALNLVVIRSADLERAARFYSALGILFTRERHGSGPEHLAGVAGGVTLEIYPLGEGGELRGVRIGFRVASLPEVLDAAAAAGGSIVSAARESPWGHRAVVADPDGHRIELVQASITI
jgi:lactoylglutathione lyase